MMHICVIAQDVTATAVVIAEGTVKAQVQDLGMVAVKFVLCYNSMLVS